MARRLRRDSQTGRNDFVTRQRLDEGLNFAPCPVADGKRAELRRATEGRQESEATQTSADDDLPSSLGGAKAK